MSTQKDLSERDLNFIRFGIVPPGTSISRARSIQDSMDDVVVKIEAHTGRQELHEWLPKEDLVVVEDDPEKWIKLGIPMQTCFHRHNYLVRDFVNVGWGSLIGKQKISR